MTPKEKQKIKGRKEKEGDKKGRKESKQAGTKLAWNQDAHVL